MPASGCSLIIFALCRWACSADDPLTAGTPRGQCAVPRTGATLPGPVRHGGIGAAAHGVRHATTCASAQSSSSDGRRWPRCSGSVFCRAPCFSGGQFLEPDPPCPLSPSRVPACPANPLHPGERGRPGPLPPAGSAKCNARKPRAFPTFRPGFYPMPGAGVNAALPGRAAPIARQHGQGNGLGMRRRVCTGDRCPLHARRRRGGRRAFGGDAPVLG
jgi:hypothetical protein